MAKKEVSINFPDKSHFFELIENRKEELSEIKRHLSSAWIFGAGHNGTLIAETLKKNNIPVIGFIDDTPSKINTCIGTIKVFSFAEFSLNSRADSNVIISIFNPSVSFKKIADKFAGGAVKKRNIHSFIDFIQLFDLSYLFIGPVGDLGKHYADLKSSFNRLTDIGSKRTFLNYINYQLGIVHETAASPFFYGLRQHLKNKPVNFIDIGAYNGDTIIKFEKEFPKRVKTIYAFEPDVFNYQKLLDLSFRKKKTNLLCFNMAVGDSNQPLHFNNDGNMGSALSKTGKQLVQCITIDSLIKPEQNEKLVVKMDVEGAELSVLNGMTNLIKKSKPVLIISAYHKTNDVSDLLNFVRKQHNYKNIAIKQHGEDGADLSLYFY